MEIPAFGDEYALVVFKGNSLDEISPDEFSSGPWNVPVALSIAVTDADTSKIPELIDICSILEIGKI